MLLVGSLGLILLLVFYFAKTVGDFSVNQEINEHKTSLIKKNSINIEKYGVKGDGITDDTQKIQFAIEDAAKKNKMLIISAKTYLVSPLKHRDFTVSDWWCLNIPSNADIFFESGAILKVVDDAPEWTRILVIDGVSNVNIYGHLEVDGNAQSVTDGNEHMAGIFIFNAQNIFIESVYSHDSYGDNIFIGGTEDNYSNNVKVNNLKGVTAGRKNLVIHYVDNLHIGTAILDNSKGGEEENWTGANSLDLEPDNFKGTKQFFQRIDYLSTYGKGNDFTVGTKKELSKKWVLEVGDFNVILMNGSKEGLLSYAVTVKIDKLFVKSSSNNADKGIKLIYSANWEIKEAYFIEGRGYAISLKEADGEKPSIKLGKVFLSRPKGKGIELWGSDASIDYLEVNTLQDAALKVFATNNQLVTIQNFISRNSGETELIHISDHGFQPIVRIINLFVTDDRSTKVNNIIDLNTQRAVNGFEINNIKNYDNLKEFSFGPTVKTKKPLYKKRK